MDFIPQSGMLMDLLGNFSIVTIDFDCIHFWIFVVFKLIGENEGGVSTISTYL